MTSQRAKDRRKLFRGGVLAGMHGVVVTFQNNCWGWVEVGQLVAGVSRIMIADPAQIDLPMPIARRGRIAGNEGRTTLRMNRQRTRNRHMQ